MIIDNRPSTFYLFTLAGAILCFTVSLRTLAGQDLLCPEHLKYKANMNIHAFAQQIGVNYKSTLSISEFKAARAKGIANIEYNTTLLAYQTIGKDEDVKQRIHGCEYLITLKDGYKIPFIIFKIFESKKDESLYRIFTHPSTWWQVNEEKLSDWLNKFNHVFKNEKNGIVRSDTSFFSEKLYWREWLHKKLAQNANS